MTKISKIFSFAYWKILIQKFWITFIQNLKQGSVKNFLSFSSILKLLFIYSSVIIYIIIFEFDFSPNIFKETERKIAIYSVNSRIGEHLVYERSLRALNDIGVEFIGCSFSESMINEKLLSHFYTNAASIVNFVLKPKFNLALTHYVKIVPYGKNAIYINVPDDLIYQTSNRFLKSLPHLSKYDIYIDLYSVLNETNPLLKSTLKNYNKQNVQIIPAYLAQNAIKLELPISYQNAMISGSLWGCNRSSLRMKNAINKLAEEDLLVVYGLEKYFKFLNKGYLGSVEKYGKPVDELISLQRKHGIALVVHNLEHLLQGLPTSRFAEGIMSGSVVISDKHPFIEKYFGDNILYFDSFADSEEMYSQISRHIEWIKQNPKRAFEMSRNAYDIFIQNWTLEAQFNKLLKAID